MTAAPLTPAQATQRAHQALRTLVPRAQRFPTLRRLCPTRSRWQVEVRIVGSSAMKRLNARYRGKNYATDVLSFPAPEVFRAQGMLGELVICLPVCIRQARERGHAPISELKILLVHGLLHLLGLDHELGPKQAALMARWEQRLLPQPLGGLISRAQAHS